MEDAANCSVSVVETERAFDALEQSWNALLDKSNVSVFQTYEWQRTWWKYFGKNRTLHCVTFEYEGQLVGIAPMFLENVTRGGARIATWLQFIGAELSDYLQIIISSGHDEIVLRSFIRHLINSSALWDVFDIRDVSERFSLLRKLPALLEESGLQVQTSFGNVCPQIELPNSWDKFYLSLSRNMRRQLKVKKQRLEDNFTWELELFKNDDDRLPLAFDEFVKVHEKRWRSLGYPCAFDDENYRAFHLEMVQKFAKRGWLRIFFLKVNNEHVATSLDFNFRDRVNVYLSHAHAPEEVMRLSPGFLLRCMVIQQAIAEGMRTYDFLRGSEDYKYREFNCVDRENWSIRAISPSRSGRIHFTLFSTNEFVIRSRKRLLREYWDFKRFHIARQPSPGKVLTYAMSRFRVIIVARLTSFSRISSEPDGAEREDSE